MKIADLFVDVHLDTGAFDRELRRTLASAARKDIKVNVKVDTKSADRSITGLARNVNKASSGINTFTGRISVLADALLALAPAAVGIGAVAIPAVFALGQATLVAGGAASTALLAFQGMGDALKAMSKAALEPSTANMQAMHDALRALSPEARTFALQIFGMRDELDRLRDSAGENMFPGLSDGLEAASTRLPEVNDLLSEFGGIIGDIGRNIGRSLATDRWNVLFSFLQSNARPTMMDLSDAVGSVAHGMVELVNAFAPMSTGGMDWVADVAADFDRWATGLGETEGFQEFLDYVRTTGPEVAETVAAVAEAFIAISKAAAPIAGPVLNTIEALAKAIEVIADSPLGPALIGGALGMRMFSRGSQIAAPAIEAISTAFLDLRTSVPQTGGKLGALGRGVKGLAGPAGFVGLAASMSTTNETATVLGATLSGALIGSAIPGVGTAIGAAIGGAVGLFAGLIKAQSDSTDEMSAWDEEVAKGTTDYGKFKSIADEANKALAASEAERAKSTQESTEALDANEDGITSQSEALAAGLAMQDQYFKDSSSKNKELTKDQKDAIENYQNLTEGINDMGHALGVVPLDKTVTDVGEMNSIFQQAVPTLNAIGVSYDDWMDAVDSGSTDQIVSDMKDYVEQVDSAAGKTTTFATAVAGLDSEILTTADSAAAFAVAVESIFGPTIAAEQAAISFRESLRGINADSITAAAGLKANTAAADANKTAILGSVTASIKDVEARAAQGESAKSLMGTMLRESQSIRDRAKELGLKGKEVDDYVDKVYNVPELMSTVFQQRGMTKAQADAKALKLQYKQIPLKVLTNITTDGTKLTSQQLRTVNTLATKIPSKRLIKLTTDGERLTKQQLKNIKAQADLTPEEVRILAKLDKADFDTATETAKGDADALGEKTPTPIVKLDTGQFDTAMDSANADLTAFGQRSETATITTNHIDNYTTNRNKAGGGLVLGPGTATSDSIPARLSNGEYVMKTAAVRKYGTGFMDRVNTMRLAGGGLVQKFAAGGKAVAKRRAAAAKQRRENKQQYKFDVRVEDLLDAASEGDLASFDQAISVVKKARNKTKKWSDEWVALQQQLRDIQQQKQEAKQHLAENEANYSFNKVFDQLGREADAGNLGAFDAQVNLLKAAQAKTKKWSDEWVALQEQIDQVQQDKAETAKMFADAIADFGAAISGSFWSEGLAEQIEPGADFRNIFGGIIDQAQSLLEMGAISQATFNQINASAQAYVTQLEGLQTQLDGLDTALEEANAVLAEKTQALEEAEQALADYTAGVKDSITALGNLASMDDGVQRQAEATTELTAAQDAYNKTLVTYGANSRNTAAAATRLAAAQEASRSAALSGTEILANVQAQVGKVRSFIANVKKLRDLGVGETALREIIAMGPIQGAAYAQALATATPEVLAGIQGAQDELAAIGEEFGVEAAGWLGYFQAVDTAKAGVEAAQGIVAGLESQRQAIIDAMTSIGEAAAAAFRASLGIASPSRVFKEIGIQTLVGMQQGLVSQVPDTIGVIEGLADRLSNVGVPTGSAAPAGAGVSSSAGVVINGGVHVTKDVDVDTLTQKLDFWSRQSGRTR